VVLASRSDPPLGLARLRARGQLTEMRVAGLRFTPAEAGSCSSTRRRHCRMRRWRRWRPGPRGGRPGWRWPRSLRGHDDAAGFVSAFTGSHRYALDYLAEEVLERQDEQLRTFLLETSVLDRLSGPLCDAVTGRGGSQVLLEQAERAGLFLVPLDEVRGWWRYHHLFADLLRARLQQEQPGRLA
jgi:ATP/maltotriose-dependent transcriptional regulator MalT